MPKEGARGSGRCLRALGEGSFSELRGATRGAGCPVSWDISARAAFCQLVRGSGALCELGICGEKPDVVVMMGLHWLTADSYLQVPFVTGRYSAL